MAQVPAEAVAGPQSPDVWLHTFYEVLVTSLVFQTPPVNTPGAEPLSMAAVSSQPHPAHQEQNHGNAQSHELCQDGSSPEPSERMENNFPGLWNDRGEASCKVGGGVLLFCHNRILCFESPKSVKN